MIKKGFMQILRFCVRPGAIGCTPEEDEEKDKSREFHNYKTLYNFREIILELCILKL